MKTKTHITAAIFLFLLLVVHADASDLRGSTMVLQTKDTNAAEAHGGVSDSFKDYGETTWYQAPLYGGHITLSAYPSLCTVACDDGNECTANVCTGDSCSFVNHPEGTACTGGTCDGNGTCILDPVDPEEVPEEPESSPAPGPSTVDGTGYIAQCGDGIVNVWEKCDDGNRRSGDGCSSTCTLENHLPLTSAEYFELEYPTDFEVDLPESSHTSPPEEPVDEVELPLLDEDVPPIVEQSPVAQRPSSSSGTVEGGSRIPEVLRTWTGGGDGIGECRLSNCRFCWLLLLLLLLSILLNVYLYYKKKEGDSSNYTPFASRKL